MLAKAPVLVLHCALAAILLVAGTEASGLTSFQASQLPSSQTPPPTAAITGVVVDGTTNAPIAGVVVSLSRGREPVGPQPRQFSDAKGRFAFTNLPAGEGYVLSASKFGYFDGVYGRDAASNAAGGILSLTDGQWVADARIVLWRPAAVGGTVTDERGEPVVGVYVRVLAERWVAGQTRLVAGLSTLTDDRGRYRIPGLRPGRFLVSLPSVQWAVPATMTAAAIAGISEPVAATREVPVESALDLAPGTRVILGSFPVPPPSIDGRPATYPIMFHPAATAVADATFVELKYAEERGDVDIRLEPVAAARVAGKVQGSPDALANLTLRLLPAGLEELGLGSEAATTIVGPDGSFVFLNVAAGSYVIDVMRGLSEFLERPGPAAATDSTRQTFPPNPPGTTGSGWSSASVPSGSNGLVYMTRSGFAAGRFENARALTGRAAVVVAGQDVLDVMVQLRGAASLYGRVIVDEDPRLKSAPPASLPFRAEPANGDPRLGLPRVEGPTTNPASDEFEIHGLQPGRYLVRANLQAPWVIKSITLNGKDITETPIDAASGQDFSVVATITNAGATLSGVASDRLGQPAAGAAVLLFPVDPVGWSNFGIWPRRIKTMSASNSGTFQFAAQPAGDYYVLALPKDEIDAWQAPGFFKSAAARATRVTVGWGESKVVDVRVVEMK